MSEKMDSRSSELLSLLTTSLTLCILEVMTPQRPDFILTADVPDSEADVFVFYSFYIKAWKEEEHDSSPPYHCWTSNLFG